jgi:cytochrome c biogenesis factor
LLFVTFVMTVVGFILRTTSAKDVGRPLFGIGFSFLIVFSFFLVYMGASLAWKRDPGLALVQSVTITAHGMTATTSDRALNLDWRRINAAVELQGGFFFVFYGPPTVVLIPKRAIATNQDLEFVRRFVPKPFFKIGRM